MSAGECSHLLGSQLLPMHCLWVHLGAELCFHVGPMGITFVSFFFKTPLDSFSLGIVCP